LLLYQCYSVRWIFEEFLFGQSRASSEVLRFKAGFAGEPLMPQPLKKSNGVKGTFLFGGLYGKSFGTRTAAAASSTGRPGSSPRLLAPAKCAETRASSRSPEARNMFVAQAAEEAAGDSR
jgi:hypothetical protein